MQQVDTEAVSLKPSDVDTALTVEKVAAQVANDQKDLPAAMAAIQAQGSDEGKAAAAAASKILQVSIISKAAPTQTFDAGAGATTTAAVAASTTAAADGAQATDNANGNGNGGNNNGNGRGNGRGRFGDRNGRNQKRAARPFMA